MIAIWLAGLIGSSVLLPIHPAAFIGFVVGWSALLVLICWWKGEPARWSG